jgi:hypothetical protein
VIRLAQISIIVDIHGCAWFEREDRKPCSECRFLGYVPYDLYDLKLFIKDLIAFQLWPSPNS